MIDTTSGHSDMDYAEHTRTYRTFVRGAFVMVVLIALILLFMFMFLV